MKNINLLHSYKQWLFVIACILYCQASLFATTEEPPIKKEPTPDLLGNDYNYNLGNAPVNLETMTTIALPPETWSALGTGLNGLCHALLLDGNGNLYAGGDFTTAGGITVKGIAKWDGSSWSALGTGLEGNLPSCYALAMDSEGNLYAGGSFDTAGGISANNIAKWDGTSWSALGTGLSDICLALAVDSGNNLYAGGEFGFAGGNTVHNIAKWDGSNWSDLDFGLGGACWAIAIDNNDNVYAGGFFSHAGFENADNIAKWDGTIWSELGTGLSSSPVSLTLDSNGNLYADQNTDIYKWDGANWSTVGTSLGFLIRSIAIDETNINNICIYAAGNLDIENNHIAKWDGNAWSSLGTGLNQFCNAIKLDGTGNLYAGGHFTTAGGTNANRIAKWGEETCPDADNDGYTDIACGGDDCDDGDPNVHPMAAELCNGIDDNCNAETDENCNPPVIRVEGNGHPIANGNMTPEPYYHTDFSTPCSRTHTFEIRNFGHQTINLELTGDPVVALSGSTDFSVTKQPDLSSIPWNGFKTTFDITFTPSSPGLKTATVSIANNDPDDDPFVFAIHGYLFEEPIIYVNDDATGNNDGTSWDDAFTNLAFALYLASNCDVDVWVAEGTYHGLFVMPKNVHVLGGFPNSGNPGLADRDWDTYKTILSGDINGDDGPDFTNMEENWGGFVRTEDVGMDFLLEGFYIEGGNGTYAVWYNVSLAGSVPTIAHCTFQNNSGTFGGAAYGSVFQGGENKAIVKNCRFIHNRATFGSAAQFHSNDGELNWTFTNCTFQNNKSGLGADFSILSTGTSISNTTFTNCTFQNDDVPFINSFGSQSQVGKSITFIGSGTTSTLNNCIFWRGTGTGKTISTSGGASVNLNHTLLEENGCPAGTCGDGMIYNQDPLFMDAANGDVSLGDCSPAIDAGLDTANPLAYDIDENPRQFDAISGGMKIDMGAIENQTDQDSDDDGTPNCEDTEECDGLDNDGDGFVDEGLPTFDFYLDNDGDGYGAGAPITDCQSPGNNYVTQDGDCNDGDPDVHPTATEVCNGIDDDCANGIDDGLTFEDYYFDGDGDGYGAGAATSACSSPGNDYVMQDGDCNDSDPDVHPTATEVCNGIDDDCANGIDDGLTFEDYYFDGDGDGYGAGAATSACSSPGNDYVMQDGDCNDSDPSIFPGATEACNGIDDNCNEQIDENVPSGQTYTGNVTFASQADVDAWESCYSIIDGHLTITGYNITDLSNLLDVVEVTGSVSIYYNGALASLNGMDNLATVGGSLTVFYNFSLSDCCAIHNLVNGGVTGSISIFFNASGCNSVSDINAACGGNNLMSASKNDVAQKDGVELFTQKSKAESLMLYPNPTSGKFTVHIPEQENSGRISVIDIHGRKVMDQQTMQGQTTYLFENGLFAPGIYMVILESTGQPAQTKRLMVE